MLIKFNTYMLFYQFKNIIPQIFRFLDFYTNNIKNCVANFKISWALSMSNVSYIDLNDKSIKWF